MPSDNRAAELAGASIEADSLDREAFARLRARSPALQSLEDRGSRLYPHFAALCQDLYAALFKYNVLVRPAEQTPASAALGREVVAIVLESPGYEALRESTLLDEARAGVGVLVLGRLALGLFKNDEVVSPEELARGAALAREEEELRTEREALAEAEHEASGLGEEAQRRLDQLARELDLREQALEEDAEQARQAVELPESVRGRIRQTVEGLPDQLDGAESEAEAWGRSVGSSSKVSATQRLELGDRIAQSEMLQKLARMAGAFREFARQERRRRIPRRSAETHDVMLGDDWARILPAELVSLRHPLLGRALRQRALEGRMQVYRLEGPDDRGRGPLVVCLDGSGSMQGERDLWAKAVTLALMDIARRQRRACRVISFSDGERTMKSFDLLPRARFARPSPDLAEVVKLAEHFPGGGTNFVAPLQRALASLSESTYRRGDIVFITDGEADVPTPVLEELRAAQRRLSFHVYGIWVDVSRARSGSALTTLGGFCDEVTTVSRLTADSVKDLFVKL